MLDLVKGIVVLFIGWSSFGYFIDSRLNSEFKKTVGQTMKRTQQRDNPINLFLQIFDLIFNPYKIGIPRIKRSIVASCLTLTAMIVVLKYIQPDRLEYLLTTFTSWGPIASGLLLMVGANLIGDILSLWETRFIMRRMATVQGYHLAALLFLDIIATTVVFLIGLMIGSALIGLMNYFKFEIPIVEQLDSFYANLEYFVFYIFENGILYCQEPNSSDILIIYFYTALFTSVWLWIFLIGIKVWPLYRWLSGILDIDNIPVGSTMVVGSFFICFVLILASFFLWIFWGGHFCP